jgi:hypothetical protein
VKFLNKTDMILQFLRDRGEEGATNKELSNIALNYTSCISNLYKMGHVIQCQQIGESGTYKYVLKKLTAKVKFHPSAYEDVVHTMYTVFNGTIEGEEGLIAILDATHSQFFRKHGYYKGQMQSEYEQFENQQMHFDLD